MLGRTGLLAWLLVSSADVREVCSADKRRPLLVTAAHCPPQGCTHLCCSLTHTSPFRIFLHHLSDAYRCPNNDAEPALEAAAAAAPKPAPWTMCESLSAANCTANPACSLCTMPSGKPMCFNDKIAAKLPPGEWREGCAALSSCRCLPLPPLPAGLADLPSPAARPLQPSSSAPRTPSPLSPPSTPPPLLLAPPSPRPGRSVMRWLPPTAPPTPPAPCAPCPPASSTASTTSPPPSCRLVSARESASGFARPPTRLPATPQPGCLPR